MENGDRLDRIEHILAEMAARQQYHDEAFERHDAEMKDIREALTAIREAIAIDAENIRALARLAEIHGKGAAAAAVSVENNPLATAMFHFVISANGYWHGTATDLLEVLGQIATERVRTQRGWPTSVQALSNGLRRLAPVLRQHGVDVRFERKGKFGRQMITCRKATFTDGGN